MATDTLEEICFGIIYILKNNMAAKLDALETEYASLALTLEDIKRFYFGDILMPEINDLPAISVMGRGYSTKDVGVAQQYKDNPRIEIECYITEDANKTLTYEGQEYRFEEIMNIKIMRYARAIREVLFKNETLNSKVVAISLADVLVSNVIALENVFMKACRLDIDVIGKTISIS